MSMSSWDEDELFKSWGWEKNLIKRVFEGPYGHTITFDQVMSGTQSEEGEEYLREVVREFGVKQPA